MYLLPSGLTPCPLLCAVNPPRPPRYFYTIYDMDGTYSETVSGYWNEVLAQWVEDGLFGFRVSEIIPDLPLADNLKYRYSWRGGQETHELRKEYGEAKAA